MLKLAWQPRCYIEIAQVALSFCVGFALRPSLSDASRGRLRSLASLGRVALFDYVKLFMNMLYVALTVGVVFALWPFLSDARRGRLRSLASLGRVAS